VPSRILWAPEAGKHGSRIERAEWHHGTDYESLYTHGWQTRVLRRCARVWATFIRPLRATGGVTVVERVSLTDIMLAKELTEQTRDLALAIAAVDRTPSSGGEPTEPPAKRKQQRSPQAAATSTQRALGIVALGALLVGGVTVLTSHAKSHSGLATAAGTSNVAELDPSKVWPAGTCLGIEPASGHPTGVPVDCSAPHAEEITGAANLAAAWPGPPPSQADQDAFIRNACTRATDAYLAPIALNTTGLTMIYNTVPLASWVAGSRQVSCGIGAPLGGDRGSATLTGNAKGRLLIDGVAPVARPAAHDAKPGPADQLQDPTSTTSSPAPTTTSSPAPTTTSSAAPTTTSNLPPPPASPSPSEDPDAGQVDAGQVIEIPGLAPITLPRPGPPPPPPPGE
jgi:hypothetical protein